MFYQRILFLLSFALLIGSCTQDYSVAVLERIPTGLSSRNYQSNAAPLQGEQFIKLPTGSIKPGGWLLEQLRLQRNGLNGHLSEISSWLEKADNAWLQEGGSHGWEEVPYWLRGYASLAYALDDGEMLSEAKIWIEAILASQTPDGDFGPSAASKNASTVSNPGLMEAEDLWPNMIVLWILQDYYEYSQDSRVIPFMTRYCQYLMTIPDTLFLKSYWQNSRGGDNLWSVIWLYNRIKEPWLLELAEKIHRNTADWTQPSRLPNWHNVNIAQGYREPATYYLLTGDSLMLDATYNAYSFVRRTAGQVPGGMFGGDENCRLGYFDPRQGTETCAFAEEMASDEILTLITGNPLWAENLEDVAFNSYPAAFMPDMRSLRYLTSPNQVVSDAKDHRPSIDNGGPEMVMNPFSSRCCQHNHGFAWPFYSEFLVMATPDDGAAISLYGECSATMKVADGVEISLEEHTHYPFDETVEIVLHTPSEVTFPLYLRIPSWTDEASVSLNGKTLSRNLSSGYACIEQKFKDGDVVMLRLPMHLSMRTWQVNKNSVSVDYGPLTLSLEIREDYRQNVGTENTQGDSRWQATAKPEDWPSFDIYPASDWNYALAVDEDIVPVQGTWPENDQPFTLETVPLKFKAKGRLVPSWGLDETGLTGVLPYENAKKEDRLDEITLVPMGAARLRISAFPTCQGD